MIRSKVMHSFALRAEFWWFEREDSLIRRWAVNVSRSLIEFVANTKPLPEGAGFVLRSEEIDGWKENKLRLEGGVLLRGKTHARRSPGQRRSTAKQHHFTTMISQGSRVFPRRNSRAACTCNLLIDWATRFQAPMMRFFLFSFCFSFAILSCYFACSHYRAARSIIQAISTEQARNIDFRPLS